jgi:hypothetical protein
MWSRGLSLRETVVVFMGKRPAALSVSGKWLRFQDFNSNGRFLEFEINFVLRNGIINLFGQTGWKGIQRLLIM